MLHANLYKNPVRRQAPTHTPARRLLNVSMGQPFSRQVRGLGQEWLRLWA